MQPMIGDRIYPAVNRGVLRGMYVILSLAAAAQILHCVVLVADMLDHADVKTTRRYARSDLEQRRAALEDLAD